jgi:quercetin dioxygenase-like cupin family protein
MEVRRADTQPPATGSLEWFTGSVRMVPLYQAPDPARLQAAQVTFSPGARTAWHSHPLGQLLIVIAGRGRVQGQGGPVEEVQSGDVVWTAPEERHWHGAVPTASMTHIALQERKDGRVVDWMEKVTDEQYEARA